jgi:hypothetical protein
VIGSRTTARARGRRVFLVLVAAVGTGLTGFLGGCSGSSGQPAASTSAQATPTAATTPTPQAFQGDLRSLLLSLPPSATKTLAPGANPAGTISIDEMVANANATDAAAAAAAARTALQAAGFKQGAETGWIEADQAWVGAILYQFGSQDKATGYSQNLQSGFQSDQVFGAPVDIPGIPGGRVFVRTSISSNGRWFSEAVFAKKDITVELFVTGPAQHGPAKTTALAQAQYALLP